MKESVFQSKVVKEIRTLFPKAIIIKNDPNYMQGIPDWLILIDNFWAALEIKAGKDSSKQPNQEYYVNLMSGMSFAAFISPENKEQVLDELQKAYCGRRPRFSRG